MTWLWILCARCGLDEKRPNSPLVGSGCPRCGDRAVAVIDLATGPWPKDPAPARPAIARAA